MLFLSAFVWSISTFCLPMVGHVSVVPLTVGIIVTQVLTGAAQGELYSSCVKDLHQISLLILNEFNPLQPGVAFLYLLKTLENL